MGYPKKRPKGCHRYTLSVNLIDEVKALYCNNVNSCFVSKHFARLVGAPLVGAHHKGTHEGCPYETGLVAAKGRSEARLASAIIRTEE